MVRFVALSLMVAVCFPASAAALGNQVLINCRFGGSSCPEDAAGEFDELKSALQAAGAFVTVSTAIDSSLTNGDVRLLFVYGPESAFDIPTITGYVPGFLASGGRIVVLGDYGTGDPAGSNAHLDELMSSIPDNPLRLGTLDSSPGCSGNTVSGANIASDPLTAGLSSWAFSRAGEVTGGTPLLTYTPDGGGTASLASIWRPSGNEAGEVVAFADADGFVARCDTSSGISFAGSNGPLWTTLFGETAPPVDGDNDGYLSDVDCDDSNPFVNPGEEEECNGVDDNCDGVTDEGCEDDDDAVDDDDVATDDDDAATDDDDAVTDDDDDTPFQRGGGSEYDACSGCGGEAASAGLLPIAFLAGTRRRRRPDR